MDVVIVESPAKAKTIQKYLGGKCSVYASFGHVRDLPAKNGSVDPAADFAMVWEVDGKALKRLSEIAEAVKRADRIILATDPDREGEAIAWHVLEVLKQKRLLKHKEIQRVVFNAITKDAVQEAMRHPRALDDALVEAYLARRALDYLVGFTLSPVLWRKLPGARSAGRVQSVALRLVCERENEIETFIKKEYWSILARLATQEEKLFSARLVGADGKKIQRLDVTSGTEATIFRDALEGAQFEVAKIEAKPTKRHPAPPFTTSTLQQEASRKLGFSPARTMQLAQRLYEGVDVGGETVGLITYMRTDGVDMAPEAISALRQFIDQTYGGRYVPKSPRKYSAKAKNAQEAHEAIRPTDAFRTPDKMSPYLEGEQLRLYELIWVRTMASQMESAELERTSADIHATISAASSPYRLLELRATGQVILFDGFLTLYQEGKDDEEEEEGARLPAMKMGESLTCHTIETAQHFTEPPPRYTEATLIKRMEELGIGRPSTYATTMAVLRDRDYVRLEKKRLVPEDKGRIVTAFLEGFFQHYVEYDFTAALEQKLDDVSSHTLDWKLLLRDFWEPFLHAVEGTKELRTSHVIDFLNQQLGPSIFPVQTEGVDPRACPSCKDGVLSLKLSKFGAFIGCSHYPTCNYTRGLVQGSSAEREISDTFQATQEARDVGEDPETGLTVSIRDGRFGPYVQLGQAVGKEKPKRASLPKGILPGDITLDQALKLLALPSEIAQHPETGEPILLGQGKFGPYVKHQKTYANLGPGDEVLALDGRRAIELILEKEQGKRQENSPRGASMGQEVGTHPEGGEIMLKSGRFGPYVTWNKINATIPRALDPTTLSLEEAIRLLDAKRNAPAASASRKVKKSVKTAKRTKTRAKN